MDFTSLGEASMANDTNDLIYRQLKVRYEADPSSLSSDEKAVLLLAGIGRLARIMDERDNALDLLEQDLQNRYNRALLIVNAVENGEYSGEDAYLEFRSYLNPDIQDQLMLAKQFGWAERVNDLICRLGSALGWYNEA